MKKILLLMVVSALSLFAYSNAEAIVHVEGRYWFTSLDSKVKVTDAKNFWEARVDLNLGSYHLRYAYMPLSWDGSKTITQSINFQGKTYSASTKVDSSLDILYQRLGYRYDIIDTLGNKIGIIFDVKVLDIDARLNAPGIDKSYSVTAPIPTIGLGAQVGLPFLFSFGGEVTGMAYGDNQLIDWEASLNFNPIPFTTISGGYRAFALNVKDKDNKVDFALAGPFLMVNVGW